MELKQLYLTQLEREAAASRKAIERIPEGQNDWRPHERSMPLGQLAALAATMPGWIAMMIARDELNLDDPESQKFRTKPLNSRAELLDKLDESTAAARQALEDTTEEHLLKPWRFVFNGQVSEQPRYLAITDSVFSHLAHHRGQLTVYLRLNEARVPALYGPSADEKY